ncbi:hypothetical protein Pyn_35289 [Prunus yedoensis var. nudiflora]|uniref:Uncharacterized protein n=1 Tax=Prunus yedoensis var. nudiflora TaxID=2094558 RepID=A0A314ZH52_PRUYE|nr:hypothetical protein Pyn_35289 [Prunus yedoensis var. nudiflora]
MQAFCHLRHSFTFDILMPKHIALQHASFVSPSAPPVPKLTFGTPVPKHIALQHASFVSPSASFYLGTLPCDMQALHTRHLVPFNILYCDMQALRLRHLRALRHILLQHASFVPSALCLVTCKFCTFGTPCPLTYYDALRNPRPSA